MDEKIIQNGVLRANLTPKMARFVEEFLVDLNGSAAAKRAGYGGGKNGAGVAANRLLKHPAVAAAIAEAREERAARIEARLTTTQLTADRVLEELAHMAFVDPIGAFNKDGTLKPLPEMPEAVRRAISGVDVRMDDNGVAVTKLRFWDKPKSVELTMKHLGLLRDKVEVTGEGGEALTVVVRKYGEEK